VLTLIATNKKNAKFRLAELRHERELTQKELANIIGIDPSTIANYEVGSRSPDYFTLGELLTTYSHSFVEVEASWSIVATYQVYPSSKGSSYPDSTKII
jgi:transcriptional regulator with XRE-family HTH domain